MKCRNCKSILTHTFLDLGYAPPSNAYLFKDDLYRAEKYYPLTTKVCNECWLVQTEDFKKPSELFNSEYAYLSSVSSTWVSHAQNYVAEIIDSLQLNKESYVIEIGSNDGYLLKNFCNFGIPCLGIEPTESTAKIAEKNGVPVIKKFFSEKLSQELINKKIKANLIICNNVYAHVPDINDFTLGLKKLLAPLGTITIEFPHLMRLLEGAQFDTIYHEHFSYLSLYTVNCILKKIKLKIISVKELSTHGGSLRITICHDNDIRTQDESVDTILIKEKQMGLFDLDTYLNFKFKVQDIKYEFLSFLIKEKKKRKKIAAYGAAAKGNTLLNYAGIKSDLISHVYDASEYKQGKFMPGSHIPISSPSTITQLKPDYLIILPWNISSEIMEQNKFIRDWGGKFVVAIPKLSVL